MRSKDAEILPTLAVRLPNELRERLEEAADAHGRSLSAEIRSRLEESFLPLGGDPETNRALRYLAIAAIGLRHAYEASWRHSGFLAEVMHRLAKEVFKPEPGAPTEPPRQPTDVLAIILELPMLRDRPADDPATIADAMQVAWVGMERGTPLSRGYEIPQHP